MLFFDDAFLTSLGKKATGALLGSVTRRVKKSLSQPEREVALERCSAAGVTALVASAHLPDADHQHLLADVLEGFFSHPDLGRELQALTEGRRLDVDTLLELFEETGYDPDTLPGLDLAAALEKFEAAFLQAAVRQEVLQGEIRSRQALSQTRLLEEILEEIRGLEPREGSLLQSTVALLAEPGVPVASLREAYLNRLVEDIQHLPLGGVDPSAARTEGAAEVRLASVYTALLTRKPEELDVATLELRQRAERQALSALDVLDRERHLVLLGDPGSGKTTFVRFVGLCLAGDTLGSIGADLETLTAPLPPREKDGEPVPQGWSHGALLPVHVVLRDLAARGLPPPGEPADKDTLWRFLEAELGETLRGFAPALKQELLERGGLVLLDGLDEVPEAGERREQVKTAVQGFAATFRKCRFLVTSRTYAYQRQDWKLRDFTEAVLAPFEPWQIRHFIDHWYAHVGPLRGLSEEEAQGAASLLKSAIQGSDRLAELAPRPLLLTLMASLHAWRGGTLPERREELYADAVDLLLDQWEKPKMVKDRQGEPVVQQPSLAQWLKIDRQVVRRELDRLAFEAHRDQPQLEGTADLAGERLVAALMKVARNPEVNPSRVIEYLRDRAGLLAARADQIYAFPHRTFQEYLAACHLTESDFPYQLARLAKADPQRWREVVLLAAAKATRGTPAALWMLVDALCPETPEGSNSEEAWGARLAGEALVESGDLDKIQPTDRGKLRRLRRRQVELLRGTELPALERAGAGLVLAEIGDPREGVTSIPGLEMCWVPAGDFYAEGKKQKALAYPYWISRYPVTQAQLADFAKADGYREERFWQEARAAEVWEPGRITDLVGAVSIDGAEDYGVPFSLGNHPVVGVTWYEALAFVRWLTEWLQQQGFEGWQAHLPSEAEWEKAARGGYEVPEDSRTRTLRHIGTSDGTALDGAGKLIPNREARRIYPWGSKIDPEHANYADTGIGGTSAVGCFPRGVSPYGCEEMAGNVWEWCRDLLEGEVTDPKADVALRGGSWALSARLLAAAFRDWRGAGSRHRSIGFRVVLLSVSEHA